MEETAFEFDSRQLAETSRRFPAHRLAPAPTQSRPATDLAFLATGADFGRHAWDEGGHL